MGRLAQKLHALVPGTIAARGVLLMGLVAAAVAGPAWWAHMRLAERARQELERERDACLGLALVSYLECDARGSDKHDKWLGRMQERSGRIRWAALLEAGGAGLEFRRRTALPSDQVLAQIDRAARSPARRPLVIDGVPSARFELLTLPEPDGETVLALILDRGESPRPGAVELLAGPGLAAAAGLGLAAAWLVVGVLRPLGGLTGRLARVREGLAHAAVEMPLPRELQEACAALAATERELRRWRGEAAYLRHSLAAEVEARTARAARAERRARREADADVLTGLASRRVLERELPAVFEAQRRTGRDLALVIFDVDRFKRFNDALGHPAGDALLAALGGLLRGAVRAATDRAVRFGGDEFALLLPGTSAAEAAAVARRIVALLAQWTRTHAPRGVAPGLSAGVATLRAHAPATWGELVRLADAALYEAKGRGGGCVGVAAGPDRSRGAGPWPGPVSGDRRR